MPKFIVPIKLHSRWCHKQPKAFLTQTPSSLLHESTNQQFCSSVAHSFLRQNDTWCAQIKPLSMDLTWCILDANAYQFNLQFLHLHLGLAFTFTIAIAFKSKLKYILAVECLYALEYKLKQKASPHHHQHNISLLMHLSVV